MKKKNLLLVTAGFPYGESERSFLLPEFRQLMTQFHITILSMNLTLPEVYPIPEAARVERYALPPLRSAASLRGLLVLFHGETAQEIKAAVKGCGGKMAAKRTARIAAAYLNGLQAKRKLGEIVRRDHIDIIYTYWCTDVTLGAVMLKQELPQLKVVTRFHGVDLYEERHAIRWQPFRSLIARQGDGLYFPSEMGRTYFLEHWGAGCEEKARTCYLGSLCPAPGDMEHSDTLHLVSCSNVIPLKRIELIIDGLALLPESVKVVWNHFGDGSARQALEQRAREKLPGNIRWEFRGYVPNGELISRYREFGMDLFITTSSTEGMPVTLMEVFSLGVSAIATAVGGIPEIVFDGKTGWLLPADPTAEEVAGAIRRYLELPEARRQEMSKAAMALWQEQFDAEKNARDFTASLKALVSNQKRA